MSYYICILDSPTKPLNYLNIFGVSYGTLHKQHGYQLVILKIYKKPFLRTSFMESLTVSPDLVLTFPIFCCCSVFQLCPTVCDAMDCSTPGFHVLHYIPEFAQTHIHWVNDAIHQSSPLSPPSPPDTSIFPSIRIFSNDLALCIRWPKFWSFSFQWIFRTDFL